jgi:hypothetical protein
MLSDAPDHAPKPVALVTPGWADRPVRASVCTTAEGLMVPRPLRRHVGAKIPGPAKAVQISCGRV